MMEPWTTDSLLNDPILNPNVASQPQQPQEQLSAATRKRPRSSSPAPSKRSKHGHRSSQSNNIPDCALLASQLANPQTRTAALQTLLQLSSSHDLNYALDDDANGDKVLQALVDLVYDCLEYTPEEEDTQKAVFDAERTWFEPPTAQRKAWAHHAQHHLEAQSQQESLQNLLHVVLVIFRNLSFVAANARKMSLHDGVWSCLIGCLYETHKEFTEDATELNLALHALHTLQHLAQPGLDVTGVAQVTNYLFLSATKLENLGWGGLWLAKQYNGKEDVVDVPTKFVLETCAPHLVHIWSVFSALRHVLLNYKTPRAVLILALELLKECLDQVGGVVAVDAKEEIPSMASILKALPNDILQRLVDFLWIPRLGPDALDYVNPVHTIVSRVSTLKLRMGYDATVDTELRDRALDVLVPWLALDEEMLGEKLGNVESHNGLVVRTRLYDAVVPILTTQVGRNEAPMLATQLLKYMSNSRSNAEGLLYIQDRILELASRDARVAQLAFTHLYKEPREDDERESVDNGGSQGEESLQQVVDDEEGESEVESQQ